MNRTKLISLILALMMCFNIVAMTSCGGNDSKSNEEVEALKNCLKGNHSLSNAVSRDDVTHVYICTACETSISEEHKFSNGVCTVCREQQHIRGEYEYIYLGEYPQSVKENNVVITETQDSRGYYLGSDGSYYAKVTAFPSGMIKFNNGEYISNNTVYYFKVEPIRWRVLSDSNGEKLLLCDSIIERRPFQSRSYIIGSFYYTRTNGAPDGTFANNYEYSEIRNWLNGDFYNNYFTEEERETIQFSHLDNSTESLGYETNSYCCNDTDDKIFLLSYADVTNSYYGFKTSTESDSARDMKVSDYSLALKETSFFVFGSDHWWLRSPDTSSGLGQCVGSDGGFDNDLYPHFIDANYGVVPALRIKL